MKIADKKILAVGSFISFDPQICSYLDELNRRLGDAADLLIINTAAQRHWLRDLRLETQSLLVPDICQDVWPSIINYRIPETLAAAFKTDEYLSLAAERLLSSYPRLDHYSAEYYVYMFRKHACRLLDKYRPVAIMLWNRHLPFHFVWDQIAKERGIRRVYMEYGVLPGSFAFDTHGQAGDSIFVIESARFNKLPLEQMDLDIMEDHLLRLKESGLNHKRQPEQSIEAISPNIKLGRPVVFYAGQVDPDAGFAPTTEYSRCWHSPFFESSLSALYVLDQLAFENDWNLIYKPHPITQRKNSQPIEQPLKRAIVISSGNINEIVDQADLLITILSQCSYIALIRHKPVVMLGYNQLRSCGATYEAFSLDAVEKAIQAGLANGLTKKQRMAFIQHAACLGRHYLYHNLSTIGTPYAKTVDDLISLIFAT